MFPAWMLLKNRTEIVIQKKCQALAYWAEKENKKCQINREMKKLL